MNSEFKEYKEFCMINNLKECSLHSLELFYIVKESDKVGNNILK